MELGGIDGELVESWQMDDEMALPLIRLWCEVLEDRNQMYHDAEYASKSRHGGIVAPGPMLLPLTTRPEWAPRRVDHQHERGPVAGVPGVSARGVAVDRGVLPPSDTAW